MRPRSFVLIAACLGVCTWPLSGCLLLYEELPEGGAGGGLAGGGSGGGEGGRGGAGGGDDGGGGTAGEGAGGTMCVEGEPPAGGEVRVSFSSKSLYATAIHYEAGIFVVTDDGAAGVGISRVDTVSLDLLQSSPKYPKVEPGGRLVSENLPGIRAVYVPPAGGALFCPMEIVDPPADCTPKWDPNDPKEYPSNWVGLARLDGDRTYIAISKEPNGGVFNFDDSSAPELFTETAGIGVDVAHIEMDDDLITAWTSENGTDGMVSRLVGTDVENLSVENGANAMGGVALSPDHTVLVRMRRPPQSAGVGLYAWRPGTNLATRIGDISSPTPETALVTFDANNEGAPLQRFVYATGDAASSGTTIFRCRVDNSCEPCAAMPPVFAGPEPKALVCADIRGLSVESVTGVVAFTCVDGDNNNYVGTWTPSP